MMIIVLDFITIICLHHSSIGDSSGRIALDSNSPYQPTIIKSSFWCGGALCPPIIAVSSQSHADSTVAARPPIIMNGHYLHFQTHPNAPSGPLVAPARRLPKWRLAQRTISADATACCWLAPACLSFGWVSMSDLYSEWPSCCLRFRRFCRLKLVVDS